MPRHPILLAHSPDPDDAFMWWPITGRIEPPERPDEIAPARALTPPAIDTGRFEFRAIAGDIEALNRRAAERADLDVTALSFRAWADVAGHYALTRCGASFGDGYGPKLVCRADAPFAGPEALLAPGVRIAIPGRRTTAFLLLSMMLGPDAPNDPGRFVELPFDRVIPAVASRDADAGLVIHEGQLAYADAGLRLLADTGLWWRGTTGLPLPLGANAVRRDLDARFGPGSLAEVAGLLARSVTHAMDRWDESVAITMPFAAANARRSGQQPPELARVDRYCRMYVTALTRDMGERGLAAVDRLIRAGAAAGLCPDPGPITPI